MSDARRDLYRRAGRCGRCREAFDLGATVHEPGRYESWSWEPLPVCGRCRDELAAEADRWDG